MNVVANISYAPNYAIVSDPYSVQIQENTNENNSEYGHFSRSDRANIMLRGYFVVLGNLGESTSVLQFFKAGETSFFPDFSYTDKQHHGIALLYDSAVVLALAEYPTKTCFSVPPLFLHLYVLLTNLTCDDDDEKFIYTLTLFATCHKTDLLTSKLTYLHLSNGTKLTYFHHPCALKHIVANLANYSQFSYFLPSELPIHMTLC